MPLSALQHTCVCAGLSARPHLRLASDLHAGSKPEVKSCGSLAHVDLKARCKRSEASLLVNKRKLLSATDQRGSDATGAQRKVVSALRAYPGLSDQDVWMDEVENSPVLEARAVKRPRSENAETQQLNGSSHHSQTAVPAGKQPPLHTKALRSVLKGTLLYQWICVLITVHTLGSNRCPAVCAVFVVKTGKLNPRTHRFKLFCSQLLKLQHILLTTPHAAACTSPEVTCLCRSKLCTAMADAATKVIVRLCFHCQHKAQTYHDKCPCGKA